MKVAHSTRGPKRGRKPIRRPKRLTVAEMDRQDLIAARRAMKEPGPNIPWEQVKTDLGL